MIIEFLLPVLLLIFLFFIIQHKYFFNSASISKKVLLVGFSLKAISAILFGYFYKTGILTGGDTYMYFNDANVIFNTFKTDPFIYFKLAIGTNDFTPVPAYLLPYTDAMHFWFDSSNYFLVRINALIRPFSFGVYNFHALVFAFLSFIGTYNLYLFFEDKVFSKPLLQFILFGIPSIVFWTSGVHKEAIVIFSLGIILSNIDRLLKSDYTKRHVFYIVFGLFVLGYTRIYILAFLLPLMTALAIYKRFESSKATFKYFALALIVFALISVGIDWLSPQHSLLYEIIVRRRYFVNSFGNMSFPVVGIPHNINSALILIWEAISNPFIRPLPSDCDGVLAYLASFEAFVLLFTIFILILSVNLKSLHKNPYAVFSILFGLSILFLIGLIVNNSGAIARYRSIAIPFILIGLCLTNKKNQKIIQLFQKN